VNGRKEGGTTDDRRKITNLTIRFEESLGDDELSSQLSSVFNFLELELFEDFLEASDIIMIEPSDRRARDLDALLDREVHPSVDHDDVPSLAE
jgi:hypothetical protein